MTDPLFNLCPECDKPAVKQCKCTVAEQFCANKHAWHICKVHGKIVLDSYNTDANKHSHKVNAEGCSCGDIEDDKSLGEEEEEDEEEEEEDRAYSNESSEEEEEEEEILEPPRKKQKISRNYCGYCGNDVHSQAKPVHCRCCGVKFPHAEAKFCYQCGSERQ